MSESLWRIIEFIGGAILALVAWLVGRVISRLDGDVQDLKQRVGDIEGNIGPRSEALARVEQKLDDHIRREETITWKQLEENAKQNQEAHAALLDGLRDVSERVVAVETLITQRIPVRKKAK